METVSVVKRICADSLMLGIYYWTPLEKSANHS